MDEARPEEAERWFQIARKLLEVRDFIGCKKFAERVMDADPLLDGIDQIVAAADVLLASQHRINDNMNCAAIAFQLVIDAWNFLSDPTKKGPFDQEIKNAIQLRLQTCQPKSLPEHPPSSTFWTICLRCYGAFEYEREHQGKLLACSNCQKPFQAAELPTKPPVVPGTDKYYCSWGLFPIGFPGAPVFDGVVIPEGAIRIPPNLASDTPHPSFSDGGNVKNGKKTLTRRKPGRKPKKHSVNKSNKQANPSPERKQSQLPENNDAGGDGSVSEVHHQNTPAAGDYEGRFDMNSSFAMDFDRTARVLGNLDNLSFLKDDDVTMMQ
ncbi:hypothetical protein ZOSMA_6G01980 [Zostera marina]|uniref:J domain-containing protein n=1 Tax=Zostera marina TaxID=29655 RepID=A0A0K9NRN7_ZOSMR|nr:hypothetical protein ZOSMA_6G01980 [Zostera marina]